ncbi:leucyl/phenylalanyl-tRNA--protein transferase [Suttonella sp. R2A3]|uniref:leucyl/phenylalanyl-tRNA--protein transferase n=1 Tax=Suttonella sp. R2A3 TaxID=2908648 RepID=UPI001F385948|nr:leucyl/phenylalanyl-tRNA--protein transferase [Suttonella sp. R2A3]UJF24819.1 leucyl/phenylalanyl-tRNA--protein transferase [Suttonella sp. R2A3]
MPPKPSHLYEFPDPRAANEDGLLAIGGDLEPARVFSAHCQGIFPWFSDAQPILWWSPPVRAVIPCHNVHISRSLKRFVRQNDVRLSFDQAFARVMGYCREVHGESWIDEKMVFSYSELHRQGRAHSIEVWQDDTLIGGLYGVALNRIFCGESMFSLHQNASKIALVSLCLTLSQNHIDYLDCQFLTEHLASMGAINISREDYLSLLTGDPDRLRGSWQDKTIIPI